MLNSLFGWNENDAHPNSKMVFTLLLPGLLLLLLLDILGFSWLRGWRKNEKSGKKY